MAQDVRALVAMLWGHLLALEHLVDAGIVGGHVRERLLAKRAAKVVRSVLIETVRVHGVAAAHEDDRAGGGEEVGAAHGAVCVERLFQAAVGVSIVD